MAWLCLDQSRSESWSYLLETRYHDVSGPLLANSFANSYRI